MLLVRHAADCGPAARRPQAADEPRRRTLARPGQSAGPVSTAFAYQRSPPDGSAASARSAPHPQLPSGNTRPRSCPGTPARPGRFPARPAACPACDPRGAACAPAAFPPAAHRCSAASRSSPSCGRSAAPAARRAPPVPRSAPSAPRSARPCPPAASADAHSPPAAARSRRAAQPPDRADREPRAYRAHRNSIRAGPSSTSMTRPPGRQDFYGIPHRPWPES